MAKHSAPSSVNWVTRIVVALVALLVVVGGISAYQLLKDSGGDDTAVADGGPRTDGSGEDAASGDDADAAEPESCEQVTVWSAPELLSAVEAAAERATDDCFTYAVVARETATAQAVLKDGEAPDVWLPSSVAWAQLAAQEDVELEVGATVASSPVMLTSHPEVIAGLSEIGVTPEATFGEVVQTYTERLSSGEAEATLRLGDARNDPATMALLGASIESLGNLSDPSSPGRNLLVLMAQTAVQGDPLSAVRSDPTTIVPAAEYQIARATADGAKLQGITLKGGVGTVIMPFVRVADEGSAQAVDALEQQLLSEEGAADLRELDLRPGADGEAPGVDGVPDELPVDTEAPAAETTTTLAKTWSLIAPQSRILTLIDISGSMEVPVDGEKTRIDLTREATQTALEIVPGQTGVGLWYFATALDGDNDYREVVPLRPLNEEVRSDVTHKDVVMSETANLGLDMLQGDTGLHDSLWAAYEYMQDNYTPEAISSVLLLTDGINDDSTGGLSEDEVIDLLAEARESGEAPVTVVLIGMGPDVDAEALDRLAVAAGGESFVLRDPRELPQVFVDVVASRTR